METKEFFIKKNFKQNDWVWIRRLGDGRQHKGKIVGKASEHIIDFYIIELVSPIPGYEYTHCVIPEACLDKITL